MTKKITVLAILLFVLGAGLMAQPMGPTVIEGSTVSLVDSTVYNGIYRGVQCQFFLEPTTGNMVIGWYEYYGSSDPNPRRITMAISTDGGQTWQKYEEINNGVGDAMNGRYASVWGTSASPLMVYADRNPGGTNRNSRPVFVNDILGWGGGILNNTFVDDMENADTTLYSRYNSLAASADNENFMAVGSYHNADPGEALYCYISKDGGASWSSPKAVISAADADSGKSNYVYDVSSSGLGVGVSGDNFVMAVGLARYSNGDDLWQLVYTISEDAGATWSPVSLIPGAENLEFANSDVYFNFTSPLRDKDGGWHVFALGVDTTEDDGSFPQKYRAYDFRYDGSAWTINKFVLPAKFDNGLVAWGDYPADEEQRFSNTPSLGPDGTLYYVYTDLMDTTGTMGNLEKANFHLRVVYSEDNGTTWQGPVSLVENWNSPTVQGAARFADENLHVIFKDTLDDLYHLSIPTQTIKDLATGLETVSNLRPKSFHVYQNYPNPFNPVTNIRFDLPEKSHVRLTVYNALGQQVARLIDREMSAGFKGITWDASNMPSGIYFYRIEAGSYSQVKRMVLIK